MAAQNGVQNADLESLDLVHTIEAEILLKCQQSPDGSITMADLLIDKPHPYAILGICLMVATKMCGQGKVRLQQKDNQLPGNAENLIISLIK